MKYSRAFNIFILIFGVLCILYYIGMGLAVRFGQSLLFLWPLLGAFCIGRFMMVRRAIIKNEPLPFPQKLIKVFRICVALALAVFLAGEAVICSGAFHAPTSGLDCIIVLGAKVNGKRPSGALAQRIGAAADYLWDNPDTLCIASGGQGADEGISEAECIRINLEYMGIEPGRIIMEDWSVSTLSNIQNSLPLLPTDAENIGIVTNDFHIFRALGTARHVSDLNFFPIPAKSTPYGFVHYAMREFFATTSALAKGEISFS